MPPVRALVSYAFLIASSLLCLITMLVAIRSYWVIDSFMFYRPTHTWQQQWLDRSIIELSRGPLWELDTRRGCVRILHLVNDWSYSRSYQPTHWSLPLEEEDRRVVIADWHNGVSLGFGFERRAVPETRFNLPPGPNPPAATAYVITAVYTPLPLWSVFFATPPLLWLCRRLRRRRLIRQGRCRVCGYDLRASPASCPECGTASPV